MPEIKNTFLEGKMNKDLDARLLKNGEYFDAQNVHVTKSEGSDVGTAQNILGNKLNYTVGAFNNRTQTIGELKVGTPSIGIVTTNSSNATNSSGAGYSGTIGSTSGFTTNGNGIGGNITVKITGGAVTEVIINVAGKGYKTGETITISKDVGSPAIGGSTSVVLTLRAEDMLTGSAAEIVTTNTTDGTNAAGAGYSGTPGVTSGFLTSGSGVGGTVNIIIDNNTVTKVTLSGSASGYKVGDTITISKTQGTPAIGGSTSVVLTLRLEDLLMTGDVGTVIGYFADSEEKNSANSIYYFVKGNSAHKDNIYYYQEGSATAPVVLIDNSSNFLKFDEDFLITGVNLIDDLLFWTDDKNQPRKINTITAKADKTHYDNEDKISVAKYFPYSAPKVLRKVDGTEHGGMQALKTKATLVAPAPSSSKELKIDAATDTSHEIHVGQELYNASGVFLEAKVASISDDGLTITVDANVSLSVGDVITFLNQNNRLEEKFARFAYRFKFKDSEYSLISPFTQHCFIPQTYNDSYTNHNAAGLTTAQETLAATTTQLASFMNDASHVNLQVEFPHENPTAEFEIEKIEFLMKESDRPDIKSIAQLDITDASVGSDKIYNYTYKGSLPYKTLPEQQLTRVYDNVPTKAKAQEIIGNRVVYGNFQENPNNKPYDNDLSYSFDYDVTVSDKNDDQKFSTQYPYHTIKSRRSYQVGVVLADKYGRQSPVFLSDDAEKSIIKVAAKSSSETGPSWNGEALEITFNQKIPSSDSSGTSVLYSSTNPTGWYSYKIVVKQQEQDYYNVYAPRAMDSLPDSKTLKAHSGLLWSDDDKATWLVLHSDNINKVPRDTAQQSEDDNSVFPTDVSLYPKVNNDLGDVMSDSPLLDVISVGKAMDHGLELVNPTGYTGSDQEQGHTYLPFYNWRSNPLLAKLPDGFGFNLNPISATNQSPLTGVSNVGPFTVWETKPFESSLDIYYETVTCGLISELNDAIGGGTAGGGLPSDIKFSDGTRASDLAEALAAGNVVGSTHLQTFDQDGAQIANSGITYSVVNVQKNGVEIDTTANNFFGIHDPGNNQQQLKITNSKYYFNAGGSADIDYIVKIKAINTSNQSVQKDFAITITNNAPILAVPATATHAHFAAASTIFSPTSSVNGSADTDQDNLNITYTIDSVTYDAAGANETNNTHKNKFAINSTTGAVSPNNHVFPAEEVGKIYKVTVMSNDNSGQSGTNTDTAFCNVTIGGYFYGNFRFSTGFSGGTALCNAWCGNGSTQNFYIKRPTSNTSSSLTPQLNDLVYTDAALTTAFTHGFIVKQLVGGSDGTGISIYVTSGTIDDLEYDNNCSGYSC